MTNQRTRYKRIDREGEQDITEAIDSLRRHVEQTLASTLTLLGAVDLESSPPPDLSIQRGTLTWSHDALSATFPNGTVVSLARRGPARRILLALAHHQRVLPGRALTMHEAFEAGWPNERARPDAAASRVYTTIRVLRNLGLRPWLVGRDDGYLLAAELSVENLPSVTLTETQTDSAEPMRERE